MPPLHTGFGHMWIILSVMPKLPMLHVCISTSWTRQMISCVAQSRYSPHFKETERTLPPAIEPYPKPVHTLIHNLFKIDFNIIFLLNLICHFPEWFNGFSAYVTHSFPGFTMRAYGGKYKIWNSSLSCSQTSSICVLSLEWETNISLMLTSNIYDALL